MNKGLEIPTNIMVIMVVAVLVIIVVATYFSGIISLSMSDAQAQTAFQKGCIKYCKSDIESDYLSALNVDLEFLTACKKLGYDARATPCTAPDGCPNRCLEMCGSICEMSVSDSYANSRDGLIGQTVSGTTV